ncbi:3-dehydroquinate synthase [Sporobacter termitidis DSM 10068]|uniref:3-dehydroquinate synthase n=1 Tax=Sporobacter termitidis DSM 10068 TaxID=1123282 RepID=A0A1M5X1U9_9FIRM|nr:3-dehydroquinate synthase [Sporobacter termitidis]SHH93856.1 3-dehydroquinate synthase [Sporobacter termitidis DSM 10068]
MKTITVNASKKYDILIGPGLLDGAGGYARKLLKSTAAAVVTDDNVAPLYGDRLTASLLDAGLRVVRFVIKNGESSKNAENYIALLNFLAAERFTRDDVIVALGGGVAGDLAGFAASTYMRGMRFIQMPTTLLAAVDSSVGGKTAIDLTSGKNLAGTFFQPDLVLCDVSSLASLSPDVFADGTAEVVKYGVIADGELFELLKAPIMPQLTEIIARCVAIKRDVVEADETETGPRKLLNFGHTVAHAVEACSDYSISHGKAVAVGMAVFARAAFKSGLCGEAACRDIIDMIRKLGLPAETDFTAAQLARAALSDKKRSGGTITLVIPKSIGTCVLQETPVDALEHFIALGL